MEHHVPNGNCLYYEGVARRKKTIRTTWLEVPRNFNPGAVSVGHVPLLLLRDFSEMDFNCEMYCDFLYTKYRCTGQLVWNLLLHYGAHARFAYVLAYE